MCVYAMEVLLKFMAMIKKCLFWFFVVFFSLSCFVQYFIYIWKPISHLIRWLLPIQLLNSLPVQCIFIGHKDPDSNELKTKENVLHILFFTCVNRCIDFNINKIIILIFLHIQVCSYFVCLIFVLDTIYKLISSALNK